MESRRLLSITTTTTVNKSPADPDFPDLGQPVTISFNVTSPQGDPVPSGTVQLVPDSGTEGASTTTLVNGAGQAVVDLSIAGTHNFTANFIPAPNPDGTPSQFAPSSRTFAIFVRPTMSTSTPTATVGQPVTYTALLSPNEPTFDPASAGQVIFYLYGVAQPPVQPVYTAGKEVLASITFPDLAIGSPAVFAVYQHVPSFAVATHVQAASTTTLTATPSPSAPGQPITFTAVVNSPDAEPFEPEGTVSFAVDGVVQPAVTLLKSNLAPGQGTASFTTSDLAAGPHVVTATYSGTYYTAGSTSAPVNQAVQAPTGALTTTTLASSAISSAPNSPVTLTAVVSGAITLTGIVTFTINGVPQPAVAVAPTAGSAGQATASFTTSSLGTGVYSVVAAYSGDAASAPSASPALNQTVEFPSTTTIDTVLANPAPNPSAFGQDIVFSAIVRSDAAFSGVPGEPGGNVIFTIDGVAMPPVALTPILSYAPNGGSGVTGDSSANFLTATLSPGQHTVIATYTGDLLAAPSTSAPFTQTVAAPGQTVVNLAFSDAPLIAGSGNVVRASVNSAVPPTGTITFFVDGVAQPPQTLMPSNGFGGAGQGLADFPIRGLGVGPHLIYATYSGDASSGPATSPIFLQDVPTAQQVQSFTALGIAPVGTSAAGQSVLVTATVAAPEDPGSVPTGTITFYDGTTILETDPLPASGQVTITVPSLALGTHTITAIYSGDAAFTASSGAITQVVAPSATTTTLAASPTPAVLGQAVTLTATVTKAPGAPQGPARIVMFYDDSILLGIALPDASGQATLVTSKLGAGLRDLTAVYSGDDASASSTGTATEFVLAPAAPVVASLQRFGYHLQPTTLVLTFTGPLDPASAQDTNNYLILDARGHRIIVRSATYDASVATVTLRPSQRLNIHDTYHLTVVGDRATGVKGVGGQLIAGAGLGQPMTSYKTKITRGNLVLPKAQAKFAVQPTAPHPTAKLAAKHQGIKV